MSRIPPVARVTYRLHGCEFPQVAVVPLRPLAPFPSYAPVKGFHPDDQCPCGLRKNPRHHVCADCWRVLPEGVRVNLTSLDYWTKTDAIHAATDIALNLFPREWERLGIDDRPAAIRARVEAQLGKAVAA